MRALRIVTLSGDPQLEPSLAVRLGSHPVVELVMRCLDRVELLGAIRGLELDAIVSVGAPTWLDPRRCRRLQTPAFASSV